VARVVALVAASNVPGATGTVLFRGLDAAALSPGADAHPVVALSQAIGGSDADTDGDLGGAQHRLASLNEVAADLQGVEAKEESQLSQVEKQIVTLVRQRDAIKAGEVRREQEIAFVHAEVGRQERRLRTRQGAGAADAAEAKATTEAVQANQAAVVKAEAEAEAARTRQAAAAAEAAVAATEAEAAEAEALATGGSVAAAAAAASSSHVAAATSSSQAHTNLAHSAAALKAEKAKMEAEAEARLRAEAEEKAKAKLAAEEAAKQKVEAEQRRAALEAQRKREEAKRKADQDADSADDSFKQFMKEEDGEDQMGDTDYEDSANALAGAIGWNRNEIETKADTAVKQLTEAIGGKKVVQSLQGMMAGIR